METITTLVLGGGGSKGVAHIGVLRKLNALPSDVCNINVVCGVSIGALVGLCYVIGMTPDEVIVALTAKRLSTLRDICLSRVTETFGLDTGKRVVRFAKDLLQAKGFDANVTFGQLKLATGISFHVVTTNLSTYRRFTFSDTTTPDVPVVRAVRMSISLPFVFQAKRYKGDVHIDGGIQDSCPTDLYGDAPHVLGVMLEGSSFDPQPIGTFDDFVVNVLRCAFVDRKHRGPLIMVDCGKTGMLEYDMTIEQIHELVDKGFHAASEFVSSLGVNV